MFSLALSDRLGYRGSHSRECVPGSWPSLIVDHHVIARLKPMRDGACDGLWLGSTPPGDVGLRHGADIHTEAANG